jgi:DNA-binding transcriptional regulator YiaG
MTAVDWSAQPAKWRWIAMEFADECRAIASGAPAAGPSRPMSPLRWARLRRRLKLKQAAHVLGISVIHLARLELGRRRVERTRPELQARIRAFIET